MSQPGGVWLLVFGVYTVGVWRLAGVPSHCFLCYYFLGLLPIILAIQFLPFIFQQVRNSLLKKDCLNWMIFCFVLSIQTFLTGRNICKRSSLFLPLYHALWFFKKFAPKWNLPQSKWFNDLNRNSKFVIREAKILRHASNLPTKKVAHE